jgi:hypothetical protein
MTLIECMDVVGLIRDAQAWKVDMIDQQSAYTSVWSTVQQTPPEARTLGSDLIIRRLNLSERPVTALSIRLLHGSAGSYILFYRPLLSTDVKERTAMDVYPFPHDCPSHCSVVGRKTHELTVCLSLRSLLLF